MPTSSIRTFSLSSRADRPRSRRQSGATFFRCNEDCPSDPRSTADKERQATVLRSRSGAKRTMRILEDHEHRSFACQCIHLQTERFHVFCRRCCGAEFECGITSVVRQRQQRSTLSLPSRAREARRFPGALRRSDLLEPPGRRCGCWRRRHLRFSEIVGWQILVRGRRWSSGGRC
jgi:hypothetical protein